jgi:hypothetical protein
MSILFDSNKRQENNDLIKFFLKKNTLLHILDCLKIKRTNKFVDFIFKLNIN